MNEYLDPAYSMEMLWSELRHRRKQVAHSEAALVELGPYGKGDMIETRGGRSFPASDFIDRAQEARDLAEHYASGIEWAIWWRTHATHPNADPELFSITFGHGP